MKMSLRCGRLAVQSFDSKLDSSLLRRVRWQKDTRYLANIIACWAARTTFLAVDKACLVNSVYGAHTVRGKTPPHNVFSHTSRRVLSLERLLRKSIVQKVQLCFYQLRLLDADKLMASILFRKVLSINISIKSSHFRSFFYLWPASSQSAW